MPHCEGFQLAICSTPNWNSATYRCNLLVYLSFRHHNCTVRKYSLFVKLSYFYHLHSPIALHLNRLLFRIDTYLLADGVKLKSKHCVYPSSPSSLKSYDKNWINPKNENTVRNFEQTRKYGQLNVTYLIVNIPKIFYFLILEFIFHQVF